MLRRSALWGALSSRPAALAGFALLVCAFAFELWRHLGAAGDFWTFWAAARATAAGLDPYVLASLTRVAAPPAGPAPGPFLSPLVLAEAMAPLGALPFGAARLVWLGFNVVLSAGLVALLLALGGFRLRWPAVVGGSALLMAFQPYDLTLWLGQTDVLVVAAIAAGWLLVRRGRPYLAGLAVSLAAVDVHLIAGVGFYFVYVAVVRRQWRALLGLSAGLLVLAGASLIHPADVARWLFVALPHAQWAAIEPWDTLSVLQAGSELLGRHLGWIAAAALDLAMIGLACVAWGRTGDALGPDGELAVAAALTLATTTFAYNQDYLLLVLAFPFFARLFRGGAPGGWTGALAFSLAPGVGLAELTGGPVGPSHALFILGAPLLALAVVAALPGVRARMDRGYRWWAAAWVAATVGGYGVLTATGNEIGAEVVMLCGVMAFIVLLAAGGRSAVLGPAAARGGEARGHGRNRALRDGLRPAAGERLWPVHR